ITGIYTILVDGDDMDEPISDTVRGILDGHIVLERRLAERYQYPAVGALKSISRLANAVTGPVTQKAMGVVRRLLATYEESEDMINIGAYVKGTNPAIDEAIGKHEAIREFLVQGITEKAPITDTLRKLGDIAGVAIPASEISEYADSAPSPVPKAVNTETASNQAEAGTAV
ncbi:MAG TPA: flagellum-specific ATP synthase FliI, partial [Spirochaetia bacterium]|nr:flagellum-specific ATP synthase FliI [Spirochaetia bacterium]